MMGVFGLFGALIALMSFSAIGAEKLVQFDRSISDKEAKEQIARSGLKIKSYIPQLNIYVTEPAQEKVSRPQEKLHVLSREYANYVEDNVTYRTFLTPNDPRYREQDGLQLLDVAPAWDVTTGSRDVVVAVIDSGVDLDHEDLRNKLWVNQGEVPGNGIDDDGNGYVDDVHGYDFYNRDSNPDDDNRHGTHVAGIIGAETNNSEGIAGVSWNAKIMALKFLGRFGDGTADAAVKAIIYAADNGAHIINASWGGNLDSVSLRSAIEYAVSKGVLFVAAAGNSNQNIDSRPVYPASINVEGMLTVASVETDFSRSSFTNLGSVSVDLGAPGSNIMSTVLNHRYERLSGTSMAAPMVAGVAALMLSVRDLGVIDLKNALMSAVSVSSAGRGTSTGGILKASKAMDVLLSGPQLLPKRVTILRGESLQLTALDVDEVVEYVVSDPHIASVSLSGVLTARNGGVTSVAAVSKNGLTYELEEVVVVGASDPRDPGDDDSDNGDNEDDGDVEDPGNDDEESGDDENSGEGEEGSPPVGGCSSASSDEISSANISVLFLIFMFPLLITRFRSRQDR